MDQLRTEVTAAALACAMRLADVVAGIDEADADRRAGGLDWTVREASAHVVTVLGRALGDLRRSATAAETATLNATAIDELGALPLADLAERIRADAPVVFEQVLPQFDDDIEVPFHAGITTTIPQATGVLLLELLVHGDDIAVGAGRPWTIDAHDAALALTAAGPLLRGWLRPEARRRRDVYGFDVAPEPPLVFTIADGRVAVDRTSDALARAHHGATTQAPHLLLALLGRRPAGDPAIERFARCFEAF